MVVVLPVSVGYTKMAGMVVLVAAIAGLQTMVVHKAVLAVAREVAGSWYTPSMKRLVSFPPPLQRAWGGSVTGL
jgi:hypothetical protein